MSIIVSSFYALMYSWTISLFYSADFLSRRVIKPPNFNFPLDKLKKMCYIIINGRQRCVLYLPSTHSLVAVLDDEHLNYAVNIVNENDSLHIFTSFPNKVTTNE